MLALRPRFVHHNLVASALRSGAHRQFRVTSIRGESSDESQQLHDSQSLASSTPKKHPTPWFVEPEDLPPSRPEASDVAQSSTSMPSRPRVTLRPVPGGIPPTLHALHEDMAKSPLIDPSELLIREPFSVSIGPPLPDTAHGKRRKRGSRQVDVNTIGPMNSSLWNWVMLVQLKDGIDRTRGVTMLGQLARRTLDKYGKKIHLPPRTKRQDDLGWTMIDAHEFAIHIVSKDARDRYFGHTNEW